MLKYDEIIKKMSDGEKIEILCDVGNLSDKKFRAKGIPEIRRESFESLGAGEFPAPDALANTWDIDLIRRVAGAISEKAAKKNTDLLTVPAPGARISPYRRAISEDALLASDISGEYLEAAERACVCACVGGFGLHADEQEFLDEKPDARFLQEYLIAPYRRALADRKCAVLNVFADRDDGAYGTVNLSLAERVREGGYGGAKPVCARVEPEESVFCIQSGQLFFEGSHVAVQTALSRYKKLLEAIGHGTETAQTLEEEVAAGRALSPEMLDAATDRLLDFVFSVKRKHTLSTAPEDPSLPFRSVSESLVLLKNRNALLPLREGCSVCLIGDVGYGDTDGVRRIDICADALRARGHEIVGMTRGYALTQTRNEDMIGEAQTLAAQADAVVLFLGIGEKRAKRARFSKRISLPANQMALLDSLGEYRDKLVAVFPSEELWDPVVPSHCGAILTLPMSTKYSAAALADALTGVLNPSGKLANTVYVGTEDLYGRYLTEKHRDGILTGTFLGYRSYDTAGVEVGFPFGHGLSYTEFSYEDLSATAHSVSLTVRNVGARKGTETVQVYAGNPASDVVRPKKELVGFCRVELAPGEERTVDIPIRIPEVYSAERDGFVTESGDYDIFVGASVADIRLTGTVFVNGSGLASDGKNLNDYIHTKSNIHTDNYKLEAKVINMKRSVFNWIAGSAAILMAIVLKMYWTSVGTEPQFFVWFELILSVLGLWIFVAESVHRNELRKQEQSISEQMTEQTFSEAEYIPQYDAPAIFAKIFDDTAKTVYEEKDSILVETADGEYFADIDKEQDFERVVADFEIFALERGCKLRRDEIRRIFASLTSSRLLVFKGMQTQNFRILLHLLSDFFETALYVDNVTALYTGAESVLYKTDEQGNKIKTGVLMAIESARNVPGSIHLAALTDVTCENLESYFAPFMNYVKHPIGNASVRIPNEFGGENFQYVRSNLWFVLNLAEGESPDGLPEDIALEAVVCTPDFDICPEAEKRSQIKPLGYHQLEYLKDRTDSLGAPDEALWKKIDLLEETVSRIAPVCIGNKQWLGLENYVYAYMACGGGQPEAIDEAVAARIIVSMIIACKNAGEDVDFETLVENVFGEEHGEACKKLIRICG